MRLTEKCFNYFVKLGLVLVWGLGAIGLCSIVPFAIGMSCDSPKANPVVNTAVILFVVFLIILLSGIALWFLCSKYTAREILIIVFKAFLIFQFFVILCIKYNSLILTVEAMSRNIHFSTIKILFSFVIPTLTRFFLYGIGLWYVLFKLFPLHKSSKN